MTAPLPERVREALARVRIAQGQRTPDVSPAARRAVVVLPEHDRHAMVVRAAEYAAARGYALAGVAAVRVALQMVADGTADLMIAARDADLMPLLEIAAPLRRRAAPKSTVDKPARPVPRSDPKPRQALTDFGPVPQTQRRPRSLRDAAGGTARK